MRWQWINPNTVKNTSNKSIIHFPYNYEVGNNKSSALIVFQPFHIKHRNFGFLGTKLTIFQNCFNILFQGTYVFGLFNDYGHRQLHFAFSLSLSSAKHSRAFGLLGNQELFEKQTTRYVQQLLQYNLVKVIMTTYI